MKYEALVNFTGVITMSKGEVRELTDPLIIKDLLQAKYIKKVTTPRKTTNKKQRGDYMEEITKVSEITVNYLAEYLRIYELDEKETSLLNNLLNVAKSYIKSYTGQDDLDKYQDFVIVTLVLVQDMYDNRTLYVDTKNLNTVVETILGMHSVNLL